MGWRNDVLASIDDAQKALDRARDFARVAAEGGKGIDPGELAAALFSTAQYAAEGASYVASACMPVELPARPPGDVVDEIMREFEADNEGHRVDDEARIEFRKRLVAIVRGAK